MNKLRFTDPFRNKLERALIVSLGLAGFWLGHDIHTMPMYISLFLCAFFALCMFGIGVVMSIIAHTLREQPVLAEQPPSAIEPTRAARWKTWLSLVLTTSLAFLGGILLGFGIHQ